MAEQPNNRPPLQPTVFDVMSNWMFAEPVAGATKRANFRIKVMGNVPRMVVKTNVPDDKNNGRIDFNMDTQTFAVIVSKIRRLAEGTATGGFERGFQMEYNDDFIAGKKLDKAVTVATVKVGKDENGRIYIAVLGYNRPKIRFFFGPSKYHALKFADGSDVTDADVSCDFALGWCDFVAPLVMELLNERFDPDAKNVAKAPSQQGGGYNNQGGGQRQGGGGQSQGGGGGQPGGGDFGNIESFDEGW